MLQLDKFCDCTLTRHTISLAQQVIGNGSAGSKQQRVGTSYSVLSLVARWTEIINYGHLSIENASAPVEKRKIRFDHDSHCYRIESRANFRGAAVTNGQSLIKASPVAGITTKSNRKEEKKSRCVILFYTRLLFMKCRNCRTGNPQRIE